MIPVPHPTQHNKQAHNTRQASMSDGKVDGILKNALLLLLLIKEELVTDLSDLTSAIDHIKQARTLLRATSAGTDREAADSLKSSAAAAGAAAAPSSIKASLVPARAPPHPPPMPDRAITTSLVPGPSIPPPTTVPTRAPPLPPPSPPTSALTRTPIAVKSPRVEQKPLAERRKGKNAASHPTTTILAPPPPPVPRSPPPPSPTSLLPDLVLPRSSPFAPLAMPYNHTHAPPLPPYMPKSPGGQGGDESASVPTPPPMQARAPPPPYPPPMQARAPPPPYPPPMQARAPPPPPPMQARAPPPTPTSPAPIAGKREGGSELFWSLLNEAARENKAQKMQHAPAAAATFDTPPFDKNLNCWWL